ncbi:phosphatidate cytidylyltransferase [Ferruginibacter sp. SUN002]|uniref:phosphatidate cytidylyltransferase n=1 Tax=Ferruginibacter sp. SUN002 TaxID=2937789 RepID=UPI003D362CE1
MALNVETLKTRSLTAAIFVVVMLTGLFWNFWSFLILFSIIHIGCWIEFVNLLKKIYGDQYKKYILSGVLYISLPIVLLAHLSTKWELNASIDISNGTYSYLLPCAIIFSIWINDTMAYIVGSLIGKTPFSKISPKKTWEGTIGGAILCIAVIGLLGYYVPMAKEITVKHWLAIAAICAVFGTAGDLLESKIKRMANVKDSGTIMPGHGGFLDRFDSLLIATPFVWVYIQLFI